MKTIVENSTGISKFLQEDDTAVLMQADKIIIGNPVQFIISCHNQSDCTLYENLTNTPEDWTGNKYFFDGTTWALNPEWVDPTTIEY